VSSITGSATMSWIISRWPPMRLKGERTLIAPMTSDTLRERHYEDEYEQVAADDKT
jgi:hypothetical protein